VARRAWALVDEHGATLEVTTDLTIDADPGRLTRALENLFRNAVEHGSTSPRSQARENSVEHGSTCSRTQSGDAVEHGSTFDQRPSGVDGAAEPDTADGRATTDGSGERCSATDGRGGDPLEVRVGSLDGERGFFVADDGSGIPPATRERAFDPGFTTVADGTGLGLAIVHRIFEAHGWSVEVTESETGGARFVVRGVTPVARADQ
jgi:signal transduction histidine kinase